MKTRISENLKEYFYWMRVIVIGIVLGISLQFVRAWTEPTLPAPGGNVSGPINVGATGQSKAGGLILNTGGAVNGLIVIAGKVGIGTAVPSASLTVIDAAVVGPETSGSAAIGGMRLYGGTVALDFGAQGSANPVYSWIQSRNQGHYSSNYNLALNPNGGNVGIGMSNPSQKLEVAGIIKSNTGGIMFPDNTVQTTAAGASTARTTSYTTKGDLGVHTFCALNIVQNGWNTSIGNNDVRVTGVAGGRWTLFGAADAGRIGAVCLDFN